MNNTCVISIGNLASFSRGLTYSRNDEVDFSKNVVLRSNNIDLATNTLNYDELKYISDAIVIPNDKKLQRNSIFMCMSNGSKQHLGKVAYIDKDYPYAFGGFMGLIRPNEELIVPKLLYYYFCSSKFKRFLSSIGNGANINNIKFVDIAKDCISIPEKLIQQSIVVELDKINELISLKKEQLKDYDNLAQSIFYEMFGDPVENEKGWIVKTIGDVCSLKSGDSKANKSPKGTLPYVKVGDMNLPGNENYITCSSTYVDRDYNKRGIFPIGSILFPKRGGAILTNKKRMAAVEICCDLNTMGVIPSEVLNKHYLFQWFKILDLGTICSGSTILQLNNCDIAPLLIQIPPLTLQQTFAKRIELIEQQKAEIQSTIADLETLLASRMQYWFD